MMKALFLHRCFSKPRPRSMSGVDKTAIAGILRFQRYEWSRPDCSRGERADFLPQLLLNIASPQIGSFTDAAAPVSCLQNESFWLLVLSVKG